jgi:hypothetical protein
MNAEMIPVKRLTRSPATKAFCMKGELRISINAV